MFTPTFKKEANFLSLEFLENDENYIIGTERIFPTKSATDLILHVKAKDNLFDEEHIYAFIYDTKNKKEYHVDLGYHAPAYNISFSINQKEIIILSKKLTENKDKLLSSIRVIPNPIYGNNLQNSKAVIKRFTRNAKNPYINEII